MLAHWLRRHCRPDQLEPLSLRLGEVPVPRDLDPEQQRELAALQLPLPSSRLKLEPDDPRWPYVQAVLEEEKLELRDLQVRGIREMFFSRGERAGLCLPAGLSGQDEPDDLHSGKRKLVLGFDLPRGCYATLIVKRIFLTASPSPG
jgi:tRNA pseudouridine13 synthase